MAAMLHKSIFVALLSALPVVSAWALGETHTVEPAQAPGSHWQGRVSFGTSGNGLRLEPAPLDVAVNRVTAFAAMGDYYFTGALAGAQGGGGFRATSGLIVGSRAQIFNGLVPSSSGGMVNVDRRVFGQASQPRGSTEGANDNASLSYIGIGYTGLSARRGWIFNADLGLASLSAGSAVKLGRAFGGAGPLDELRDMRVLPVVQLGAVYSF